MDGAVEINREGIHPSDYNMYNVRVDKESHQRSIVDLTQCWFTEDTYEYNDEWDLEARRWNCVRWWDNSGAIGAFMRARSRMEKGCIIPIRYADYNNIIATTHRELNSGNFYTAAGRLNI